MICPNCGKENKNSDKFCGFCGTSFLQKKPKPESKKKYIWITIAAIFLLCAILLAIFLGSQNNEEKKYRNFIEDGERYLEELEYEKAEIAFLDAIKIEPKKVKPYIQLADTYIAQEKYEDASDILDQAEEILEQLKEQEPKEYEEEKKYQDEIKQKKDQMNQEKEVTEEIEYSWVLEPSVEVDDIFYLRDMDVENKRINELNLQLMGKYAAYRQGEYYGFIDWEGNKKSIEEGKLVYTFEKKLYLSNSNRTFELENDNLIESFGREYSYAYYFMNEGQLQSFWSFGEEFGVETLQGNTIESAIPVQEDSDGDQWKLPEDCMKAPYAIYKNGKLVTQYIYEECGTESEDLLAVKKNGKWGYVNTAGKVVIPIEYEASWKYYYEDLMGTKVKEYCYAVTEHYIPLCKNQKWELRDVTGKIVIPSGKFETICPVFEGKCWVKKDGKWGIIQIGKQEENTTSIEQLPSNEWKELYVNYINEHEKQNSTYKLVNINDDNIPELYIDFGTIAQGGVICTCHEGKIVEENVWNYGFSYIEGQNLFKDSGAHMHYFFDNIYSIKNGQFVLMQEGEISAPDNANVQFDSNGNAIYQYQWNGTMVASEEEYRKKLEEVYHIQQESRPFDGAEYDGNANRYVGNGLCNYQEIIEAINTY